MTTVPQPQCFSSLATIKNGSPITTQIQRLHPKSFTFAFKSKNFRVLSTLGNSSSRSSSEKPLESSPSDVDPVKLAFDKAKAYKKAIQSNPTPDVVENPVRVSDGGGVSKNVEALKDEFKSKGSVKLAIEKSKEFAEKNENPVQELDAINKKDGELKAEPLKTQANDEGNKEENSRTAQQAFEEAKDYRKKKNDGGEFVIGSAGTSGLNLGSPKEVFPKKEGNYKKKELRVSSIDFVGLEFSEKKRSRGLPPGLVPTVDPFAGGDLPDVEILIGDTSKFAEGTASSSSSEPVPIQNEESEIYKPKVSTWGVFPRPSNISKTYGGGRTIKPGQLLETKDDRAAKEARTRQLLANYKSKIGMNVDPKLKSECEDCCHTRH